MATWKRLTRDTSETPIDVNMEHVVEIERAVTYSVLTFNFSRSALLVKETPDEIHARIALVRLRHHPRPAATQRPDPFKAGFRHDPREIFAKFLPSRKSCGFPDSFEKFS